MINYDPDDLRNAALCAWKEARGEGQMGMRAVLHVLKNRVGEIGFPHTLHDVIFQKNAFTSMSVSSDPEFNLEPAEGVDPQFTFCTLAAPAVLDGQDPDPTGGAHYYENPRTATSGWFGRVIGGPDGTGTLGHPRTAIIGSQWFYR